MGVDSPGSIRPEGGVMEQDKWWDKHSEKWRLYPHMIMEPSPEENGWRCDYCNELIPWGEPDEDGMVSCESDVGCTERKKPCKWCGESPLCAPDCVGIRMLFSDPKVYVAGANPFEEGRDD
ncbi:hypothetical protein LCGC14_0629240 [marine sediment metagenome]|uniref:Uncharacterized protein n=1 Tax=marine sediment metagenome TaxID=412755 RepID=A0A0F9R7J2_9ZZZZ